MYSLRTNILEQANAVDARGRRCEESRRRRRARGLTRLNTNPFIDVPEAEFVKTFRLGKDSVRGLIEELVPHMARPRPKLRFAMLIQIFYVWTQATQALRMIPLYGSRPLSQHLKQITENSNEQVFLTGIFDTDGVRVPGTECDFQFSRSGNRPTHGRLYSPRYPSIYPNNVRCSYHFHARPKERVKIVFEEVSLQKGDVSCLRRADIIKVFDGRDTNSPTISMLCNELTGYEVLSTGPALLIQFTANSATPGQGFAATFLFQPPPDSTAADSDRLLKLSFGKAFESLGPEVSATNSVLLLRILPDSGKEPESSCTAGVCRRSYSCATTQKLLTESYLI